MCVCVGGGGGGDAHFIGHIAQKVKVEIIVAEY